MKLVSILAGAVLASSTLVASAADLTLFGEQLHSVDRAHLRAAAKAAGAKLVKSTDTTDLFNAKAIGLLGAQTLELVFLNDHVVMAQYTLEKGSETDERFRKMLVAKYGFPQSVDDTFHGSSPQKFDQQYVGDSKYRWRFDNDMELVFSKEFFGERYLTYLNKPVHAQLKRKLEAAEANGATRAAKAKSSVF